MSREIIWRKEGFPFHSSSNKFPSLKVLSLVFIIYGTLFAFYGHDITTKTIALIMLGFGFEYWLVRFTERKRI